MSRFAQVKIVEPQSEEINQTVDMTNSEAEALLYKYSQEAFKDYEKQKRQQHQPQPLKKFNADGESKPNGEYYDVKYSSISLDNEEHVSELNFKIEIKSDMPL